MDLQTEGEGEREGEREHAHLARDSRCGEIKGELFRTSSFHPSSRRNRKTAGHRTLLHLIIFALFHTYTYTYTYIYIHTHPRGRCERSVSTPDWLTYVHVYVCVYACQHPSLSLPPGGPSLKIGPQSKKVKKQLLLSCLPTISNNLNNHK